MESIYTNPFQTRNVAPAAIKINVFDTSARPIVLTFSDVIAWKKSGYFQVNTVNLSQCNFCKKAVEYNLQNAWNFKLATVYSISCRFEKNHPKKSAGEHIFCDECIALNSIRYPGKDVNDPEFFSIVQQEDFKMYLLSSYRFFEEIDQFLVWVKAADSEELKFALLSYYNDKYGGVENKATNFGELLDKCYQYTKSKSKDYIDFISSVHRPVLITVIKLFSELISSMKNDLISFNKKANATDVLLIGQYHKTIANLILETEIKGLLKEKK